MYTYEPTSEDFTLSKGGPLYNLVKKIPFLTTAKKAAVFGLCITWLPLVIICAFESTLVSGVQIPFLFDWAIQMRVLVAFPIMIIISTSIENNVLNVLKFISIKLLNAKECQLLINTSFRRARKLSSSAVTEIVFLLIIFASTVSMVKGGFFSGLEAGTTTWMAKNFEGVQQFTLAGYWSIFICIPVIQFFILKWTWRYIVWIIVLFRISKTNIKLIPTHSDKAGGIGILMIAQRSFSLFFVAVSVILSGELINTMLKHPDAFDSIRSEAIGFIIMCVLILIFPIAFFSGKLFKTKNDGMLRLSNLGADMSRKFEREWVNDQPLEKILEQQQVNPSLLYDYAGMYNSVQEIRIIPVTMRDIITMSAMLFVPFIPIVLIHFSIAELLQKISGVLI